MSVCRKRLRLSPSKPAATDEAWGTGPLSLGSHDALLTLSPPGGGAIDEKGKGHLLVEEDPPNASLGNTQPHRTVKRKAARKRKRKEEGSDEGGRTLEEEEEGMEIDRQLDQSLETKSKQHNLTSVNVRNILHEVITNEHVVAMVKAAINETDVVPPFEPKMTRSKLKEVVERGVVIPAWNMSPVKKSDDIIKPPQFVDIPLAEEDSSDEEYRPDEEDEDETAEETFQESDMESTASSPRGSRLNRAEEESCSPWQNSRSQSRCLKVGSMGPPPPPPKAPPPKSVPDFTFLEKLHAVEEELAVCMDPFQPLSESDSEASQMAYRTRSKRPLRDVPLGQLEAELKAPDITPDMYESSFAPEDREWTDWLRGLMSSDVDNEEECDDEDDPEYNFLADMDEPDLEDYRDDKAVRITKKEVNELMEELFDTLKEDLMGQEVDDEGHEEEEEPQEETPTVNTDMPVEQQNTAALDEEVGDGPITEQHTVMEQPITELRTVKQQLEFIRKTRHKNARNNKDTQDEGGHPLRLNAEQKTRLQQHVQQHVQLLVQVHLLTSPVSHLKTETETCHHFLTELDLLAQTSEMVRSTTAAPPGSSSSAPPRFCSAFRASNLKEALQLLEELRETPIRYQPTLRPCDARGRVRSFPVMPAELAWIFSTRPVFLYPELLPCASLDPDLYGSRRMAAFTAAEDCLLVLGLRNMEGSCDPPKLVSQFLLRKTVIQVRRRILQCCRHGYPDNIIKTFRYQRLVPPMVVLCRAVSPSERRPPVEREESILPLWLQRSLPVIYPVVRHYNGLSGPTLVALPPSRGGGPRHSHLTFLRSRSTYSFPTGTLYPPRLPENLDFRRMGFVLLQETLLPPSPTPPPPSPVLLPCLLLNRTSTTPAVSMETREQIVCHSRTLATLRRRGRGQSLKDSAPPKEVSISSHDVIRAVGEEEDNVVLVLSETSPSSAGSDDESHDLVEAESDSDQEVTGSEQEVTVTPSRTAEDEEEEGPLDLDQEELTNKDGNADDDGGADEGDAEGHMAAEDVRFAQDYLYRALVELGAVPGAWDQLLQALEHWGAEPADRLYGRLSDILRPWPQLVRDFAAFLNHRQARRCGLLPEQRLFQRGRQLLRQLGRSLGESSTLYKQVVSLLQGSSAPSPTDKQKLCSLLKNHPHLQQEVHTFFKLSAATDRSTHGSPAGNMEEEEQRTAALVCAKNVTVTSTGEKVVSWTREADRIILTSCQQRGANRKTFREVSTHLGNKTVKQVQYRFQELMRLFHTASRRSTPCSSEGQPVSSQEVVEG
ncbi:GON-4-like protein [Pholidichthys leucotaenia]